MSDRRRTPPDALARPARRRPRGPGRRRLRHPRPDRPASPTRRASRAWRWSPGAPAMGASVVLAAARRAARRRGRRPVVSAGATCPARDRSFMASRGAGQRALNLAMFVAFLRIGIALTLLVFYCYPAFVALASVVWFGERLDRVRWAALGLSLVGARRWSCRRRRARRARRARHRARVRSRPGADVLRPGRAPRLRRRARHRRQRPSTMGGAAISTWSSPCVIGQLAGDGAAAGPRRGAAGRCWSPASSARASRPSASSPASGCSARRAPRSWRPSSRWSAWRWPPCCSAELPAPVQLVGRGADHRGRVVLQLGRGRRSPSTRRSATTLARAVRDGPAHQRGVHRLGGATPPARPAPPPTPRASRPRRTTPSPWAGSGSSSGISAAGPTRLMRAIRSLRSTASISDAVVIASTRGRTTVCGGIVVERAHHEVQPAAARAPHRDRVDDLRAQLGQQLELEGVDDGQESRGRDEVRVRLQHAADVLEQLAADRRAARPPAPPRTGPCRPVRASSARRACRCPGSRPPPARAPRSARRGAGASRTRRTSAPRCAAAVRIPASAPQNERAGMPLRLEAEGEQRGRQRLAGGQRAIGLARQRGVRMPAPGSRSESPPSGSRTRAAARIASVTPSKAETTTTGRSPAARWRATTSTAAAMSSGRRRTDPPNLSTTISEDDGGTVRPRPRPGDRPPAPRRRRRRRAEAGGPARTMAGSSSSEWMTRTSLGDRLVGRA